MANSPHFQQDHISAALSKTGAGKSLDVLDRAAEGSIVVLLRDGGTATASPISRAYEFPTATAANLFKANLVLISRRSVFTETHAAEHYNKQFELGAES
jgi:hypothetical protein